MPHCTKVLLRRNMDRERFRPAALTAAALTRRNMPRRFLIVEDHPLFAEALQLIIGASMSDVHNSVATTLGEAKAALERGETFDLVLLDLWLPDTHGFDGVIQLRGLFPKLPIVIVSAFANQSVVEKAIVCGAAGFIPKSAKKEALLQVVASVLAGDIANPTSFAPGQAIANLEAAALTNRLRTLTRQQLRVLQMLCQGLLNKQIAFELDVGETTVKAHLGEIFRKLSVCSRTQAVAEVSKLDLGAVLALYVDNEEKARVSS
jgi:DNA-binding NarL/FixJ family response regulator